MTVTTTVLELHELLASDRAPAVLDVRWALGDPHGREHYAEGHIPGAVSAPTGENLAVDGTFLPADVLRERFEKRGAGTTERIGVYCGSGVTAAHQIAALEIAGFEAVLFPGSWSAWSADPTRPAATGPLPS